MPSGYEVLAKGGIGSALEPVPPVEPPKFWQEFIRVQSDKLILIGLIIYLFHCRADERLISGVIGALTFSLQSQRFRLR